MRELEKKNFLVRVGMQSIPHNATLLQLLQRLVPSQDNETTTCGVRRGGGGQLPSCVLCNCSNTLYNRSLSLHIEAGCVPVAGFPMC